MPVDPKPTPSASGLQPAPRPPHRRRSRGLVRAVGNDLRRFSPWRTWTVARLAVSEALRLHVLWVIPLGLLAIILTDASTRRFDPVFDTMSSLIRIAELVIVIVGLGFAVFLSTYSLPRELTSRTIYALVTKPVSRLEIIVGKALGLMVVLAVIIFGLGLASLGYIEWRAGQVQHLADQRYQQWARDNAETLVEGDVTAADLKAIADEGPLRAVVYKLPDDPVTIVAGRPLGVSKEDARTKYRGIQWLTGAPTHRASWGFEDLPPEQIDEGKAKVVIRPLVLRGEDLPEPERPPEVLVRLLPDQRTGRLPQSMAVVLAEDGTVEIPIPPKPPSAARGYRGERFWVSLCGSDTPPLGVSDEACQVVLSDGQRINSRSGLKLATEHSRGKYWIGGEGSSSLLMAGLRFRNLPASRIPPEGTVVQVDVAVPTASDIPPEARASVLVVNEDVDSLTAVKTVTFRPEKRVTALVPLSRDEFAGGTLAVYIRSNHPSVEVGVADSSARLRLGNRPFTLNWLKDAVMMWLGFCVLGSIGVVASTIAGWQVASILTGVMFLVANVWAFAIENVQRFGISLTGSLAFRRTAFQKGASQFYEVVFGFLGAVLPNFGRMDYGDTIARGEYAPLAALLAVPDGAVWYALVYMLVMVLLGYLLFLVREVAR